MNQPKFKFGDKVTPVKRNPEEGEIIFVIDKIWKSLDSYNYTNTHIDGYFSEEDIALYQEPQKKKLYAYANGCYEVIFMQIEEDRVRDHQADVVYSRTPDYDIEYPEEK